MTSEEIGELLDDLQKRVDRCKVMFEQYFLGIQKTPPYQLQIELERKVRKLTQSHISNTGLRFRFTTLSQKFASYNTYWKRTMRQIENGSYIRDIAKLGRDAVRLGKDVPEELLAKMPKRMRERILRDRAVATDRAKQEKRHEEELRDSGKVRNNRAKNVHSLDFDELEDLDSLNLDSLFAEMQSPGANSPEANSDAVSNSERSGNNRADTDIDQLFDDITNQTQSAPTPPAGHPDSRRPASSRPAPARPAPARPAPARPAPARPAPARSATRPSARPVTPPAQRPPPVPRAGSNRPAAPGAQSSPPPPGMSVREAQTLFKSYKKARELVGQDTSKLNYDRLMRSLNKQAPTIMKKHNAKAIKFDVVVKGDQVVLKAKPEK